MTGIWLAFLAPRLIFSENKSVKETFDKIFGAERYTKALDEIRKIQKDLGVKQKGLEDALKYIEEKKKLADKWKKELAGKADIKLEGG